MSARLNTFVAWLKAGKEWNDVQDVIRYVIYVCLVLLAFGLFTLTLELFFWVLG